MPCAVENWRTRPKNCPCPHVASIPVGKMGLSMSTQKIQGKELGVSSILATLASPPISIAHVNSSSLAIFTADLGPEL